jgi:hypothetical protein
VTFRLILPLLGLCLLASKNPPEITQVRADLADLFPTPELNQEQTKAGLEKLRERSEEARKFFDHGR